MTEQLKNQVIIIQPNNDLVKSTIQWNLDLTKSLGTGQFVHYMEGLLYRKPQYNEF